MKRIGLIAGEGILPVEFIRSASEKGDEVVVFAVREFASPEIEKIAKKVYWVNFGDFAKFLFLIARERVNNIIFLGKVKKERMYEFSRHDSAARSFLKKISDKKDYSLLKALTDHLAKLNINLMSSKGYLDHLLAEKGVLTARKPQGRVMEDIEFGFGIAKKIAGMDIGQTIVVKDKSVVAVEAMEGTDVAVERAYNIAGSGCVMIKVSRPEQDMRWDVPVIGPGTILTLAKCGYAALGAESGKMFLLEKNEFVKAADANDIAVVIV